LLDISRSPGPQVKRLRGRVLGAGAKVFDFERKLSAKPSSVGPAKVHYSTVEPEDNLKRIDRVHRSFRPEV